MTQATSLSSLRVSDGISIAYRFRPGPVGRPVVALVHSLGLDHSFWDLVAERLAADASVLALDARGHGASGLGDAPLTAKRMAQDLREVVDHLALGRVVVGGASMGGCIALQFAADHAERTRALALVDTTAWYGPTALADWETRARKAVDEGLASMTDFQVTRWFSDGFRAREAAVVQRWVDLFRRNRLEGYTAACRMLGAFDARSRLAGIRVPTLVQVGDEDYAAPVAMAEALHAGIAESELDIIEGARHLTPLEVPDRIAGGLRTLCARSRSARS
jgi:3-oxoadipate enol-lactonase